MPEPTSHEVHDEGERGRLLPVELADVDFDVCRVFTVTSERGGSHRGDHSVPCSELLVLVSGTAHVDVDGSPTTLSRPGQGIRLHCGEYIRYTLEGERSTILVLADEPYRHGEAATQ